MIKIDGNLTVNDSKLLKLKLHHHFPNSTEIFDNSPKTKTRKKQYIRYTFSIQKSNYETNVINLTTSNRSTPSGNIITPPIKSKRFPLCVGLSAPYRETSSPWAIKQRVTSSCISTGHKPRYFALLRE